MPATPVVSAAPPPRPPRAAGEWTRGPQRAFTLTELVLGVVILGLVLAIAGTFLSRYWRRQHCAQLAQELRTFATAFQDYERRHSAWPAASNGNREAPRGMESALAGTTWSERTSIGGRYQWLVPYPVATAPDGSRAPGGAIAITAFRPDLPLTVSHAELTYLDTLLDDGNLATGNFRAGFNGWPIYLVAPRR